MSRKQKSYKLRPFECTGEKGDSWTVISNSQFMSEAFQDLTKNQMLLYYRVKGREYGFRKPAQVYKENEKLQDPLMVFYSIGDAIRDGIYTRNNETQFRKDMKALIEHGFLTVIMNGKNQKKKSVYKLVSEWRKWKPKQKQTVKNPSV